MEGKDQKAEYKKFLQEQVREREVIKEKQHHREEELARV